MPNDVLIKLSSRTPQSSSLDGHADEFYGRVGKHYVAVIDFRIKNRTEVDEDTDEHPVVRLEINSIEVAYDGEDAAQLRTLMQGIYLARTADGTLDSVDPEKGEVHRTAQDGDVAIPITGAGKRRPAGGGGRG